MTKTENICITFKGEKKSYIAQYWLVEDQQVAVFKNKQSEPRFIALNPGHIHFFADGVENIGAPYLYDELLSRGEIKILTASTKLIHRLAKLHEMASQLPQTETL